MKRFAELTTDEVIGDVHTTSTKQKYQHYENLLNQFLNDKQKILDSENMSSMDSTIAQFLCVIRKTDGQLFSQNINSDVKYSWAYLNNVQIPLILVIYYYFHNC